MTVVVVHRLQVIEVDHDQAGVATKCLHPLALESEAVVPATAIQRMGKFIVHGDVDGGSEFPGTLIRQLFRFQQGSEQPGQQLDVGQFVDDGLRLRIRVDRTQGAEECAVIAPDRHADIRTDIELRRRLAQITRIGPAVGDDKRQTTIDDPGTQ